MEWLINHPEDPPALAAPAPPPPASTPPAAEPMAGVVKAALHGSPSQVRWLSGEAIMRVVALRSPVCSATLALDRFTGSPRPC